MRRMVSLTSAAKKAGKRERSEASCDEEKIAFLWWLPPLQTIGPGENSLWDFSKAEIYLCLTLYRKLLSILLKSSSNVFKEH